MVPSYVIAQTPTIGLADGSWKKLSASEVDAFARYLDVPGTGNAPALPAKPRQVMPSYQPLMAKPVAIELQGDAVVSQQPVLIKKPRLAEHLTPTEANDLLNWQPLESSFQFLMLSRGARRPN